MYFNYTAEAPNIDPSSKLSILFTCSLDEHVSVKEQDHTFVAKTN